MTFTDDTNFIPLHSEFVYGTEFDEAALVPALTAAAPTFLPRSRMLWVPFSIPVLFSALSFLAGGIHLFTDAAMVSLTVLCIVFVGVELFFFPRRYGIGGLLLFGGVLVWFCHDYCVHWLAVDVSVPNIAMTTEPALARQVLLYTVFVMFMVIGLNLPIWGKLETFLLSAPEPASPNLYTALVLLMFGIGLSAFLFTSDNFFVSVAKGALCPWLGHVNFEVSRTGNYNYNWGAYVGQIIDVGLLGAIIAALDAVLVTKSKVQQILCWFIWLYWCLYAYGTDRRGQVVFEVFPAMGFIFLKHMYAAAAKNKRQSLVPYLIVGALGVSLLLVVQIQGTFRGRGLENADVSQVNLTTSQGNLMFSEAMPGFARIPDQLPFFSNRFPGEGAVRAIPETLLWFLIGPIPRALWNSKPTDQSMIWYNRLIAGTDGVEGTTVSQGLVGHWYFRYGFFGMIEGAMLVGWLMRLSERILQGAAGRPMTIMIALCLASWIFRIYRNFYFIEFYGPAIGISTFVLLVKISRAFTGPGASRAELAAD